MRSGCGPHFIPSGRGATLGARRLVMLNGHPFRGHATALLQLEDLGNAGKSAPAEYTCMSLRINSMASRKDHKILLEEWEMPTKWWVQNRVAGG